MSFFDKFAELCTEKRIYPATACREMGLSPSATSRWKEGSTPNRSTLFRMAKYFGYEPDDFIAYSMTDVPMSTMRKLPENVANEKVVSNFNGNNYVTGTMPLNMLLSALNNPVLTAYAKILERSTPEQREYLQQVIKELCDAQNNCT